MSAFENGTARADQLIRALLRTCPECRGSCEDKHGNPCEACYGEGEIGSSGQ